MAHIFFFKRVNGDRLSLTLFEREREARQGRARQGRAMTHFDRSGNRSVGAPFLPLYHECAAKGSTGFHVQQKEAPVSMIL